MWKTHRVAFAIVIVAMLPMAAVQSGCESSGGTTVSNMMGGLTTTLPNPLAKVQKATVKVLKDELRYTSVSEKEDATSAKYRFLNAKDEKIVVTLDFVDENSTRINIHVGVFGDENLSNLILDKIRKRLY